MRDLGLPLPVLKQVLLWNESRPIHFSVEEIEGILKLVGGDCSFVWSPEAFIALVEVEVETLVI